MIEKKIKALRDIVLKTWKESHTLVRNEVKIIKFRSQKRFENLLKLGSFIEADRSEQEVRVIPIIQSPDENIFEEKEQELPFVEPTQAYDNLDEAGEPMGEQTPEDLRRDEPSQTEEKIEEVVKEPVSKEILEDISQIDTPQTEEDIERAATEGMLEMDFKVQPDVSASEEIVLEQEPADLVEVEEIPIEEQDESKLELQPDEVVDDQSEE